MKQKTHKLLKNGRPIIWNPQHERAFKSGSLVGYMYEHIAIAEEILHRPLDSSEVVHHIDENTKNNDKSNLLIFCSNAEHTAFHHTHERDIDLICTDANTVHVVVHPEMYTCAYCGIVFSSTWGNRQHTHAFCSGECAALYCRRVIDRPSKESLRTELCTLGSFCAVGRKYGVSDNAIRKWMK